jgi:hypothetical protein
MPATAAWHSIADERAASLFPVLTVYWPSWTGTKHYATEDYLGPGLTAAGRIKTIPVNPKSAMSRRPAELATQSMDVTLIDDLANGMDLTQILMGQADPRRSRVVLRIASSDLAEADWLTRFDGVLGDWDGLGTGAVTLHCKTDRRPLLGRLPKTQITKGALPGAPNTSLGIYLPCILGIHDSQNLSGAGMVEAVCISMDATLGYRYCPTIGKAKSVPRVYLNGNTKTIVADPPGAGQVSITYPIKGGAQLTSINFGTATIATDVVTCDIEGLTTDGTSTGPVILNPADQMRWVLVNLVYGDWRSGAYLADSTAPIDSSAWALAATYMQTFRDEGSIRLGGDRDPPRAGEILNNWLKGEPLIRGLWTVGSELAALPFSHLSPGAYVTSPILDTYLHAFERLDYGETEEGLVSQVSINHLYGGDGQPNATLIIQDYYAWVQEQVAETINMPYSSARFV